MSNVQHTQSEFVDTFGQHEVPPYEPHNINRKVLDFIDPELHADGSYTLHLDANDYVNACTEQWYSDAAGVLEFHDDGDFLSINSKEQAEEAAQKIAYEANKEVQHHYINAPDATPEEVIAFQYESLYDCPAPEFNVEITGAVGVVEVEKLVEYWEENREDDED